MGFLGLNQKHELQENDPKKDLKFALKHGEKIMAPFYHKIL